MVLEKLTTMLAEEAQLLGGIRNGVDELCDDLESMKSFLQDAEARSETNQGIRTWVKQVTDAAYDTEDVLEVFLLRLSPPRGSTFFHSFRKSYHFIKQLRTRHQLALQIQQIKMKIIKSAGARIYTPSQMPSRAGQIDSSEIFKSEEHICKRTSRVHRETRGTWKYWISKDLSSRLLGSYNWNTSASLMAIVSNLNSQDCSIRETHGMTVPAGIGRLTSLQKLRSVEVNGNGEIVRELGKLTQLRKLGHSETKTRRWNGFMLFFRKVGTPYCFVHGFNKHF
ncbi:hypothetical protein F0562_033353 [Nyssa sinensis]|uniref:Disease resistance N-terminal domain-containing protein n=1 Tax=Nyssa sinensis TaxID=561372 RepID=A0A5J5AS90_9ASTE|nr:hypothetical protein F0562_033353 [Nyssa sinensis]